MSNRPAFLRKALVAGALVTGVGFGAAGIASAATGSSSSSTSSSSGTATAPSGSGYGAPGGARPMDPAAITHGPGETLLTGTDLQKATAAARAAVPGATVIRAETDSSGASAYEVHMKKTDGNDVTVELDSSFSVVKTISGFGPGPAGQGAGGPGGPGAHGTPGGAAPSSSGTSGSSGTSSAA